jgi:hypothetical protein
MSQLGHGPKSRSALGRSAWEPINCHGDSLMGSATTHPPIKSERPGPRAAEERDELAPPNASRTGGAVRMGCRRRNERRPEARVLIRPPPQEPPRTCLSHEPCQPKARRSWFTNVLFGGSPRRPERRCGLVDACRPRCDRAPAPAEMGVGGGPSSHGVLSFTSRYNGHPLTGTIWVSETDGKET